MPIDFAVLPVTLLEESRDCRRVPSTADQWQGKIGVWTKNLILKEHWQNSVNSSFQGSSQEKMGQLWQECSRFSSPPSYNGTPALPDTKYNTLTLYCLSCHIWHVEPKFWFQLKGSKKFPMSERRAYESVDEKSHLMLCPEKLLKKEFRQ